MRKETKIYEAEVKEADEKDLTVVHFISTERPDRGGDILYAKGMVMQGKPVVLFQHGFSDIGAEPIAKPIWIKKGEFNGHKGIQAKTQFYPDELGRRLWHKTTSGYMPNWSVGWRPIRQEFKTDKTGREIRHVYEWELLEYSLVSVPMQPDAQTMSDGKEFPGIYVKMLPEAEERRGELMAWKRDDDTWEMKPYPNEHACRLEDPDKYVRIRRENDKFGEGIHAIWGILGGDEPVELQAIRFDKDKYTPAEAKKWLKEHDYKCKIFEPASEKCEKCNEEKIYKFDLDNEFEGAYICHCSKKSAQKDQKETDQRIEEIDSRLKEVEASLKNIEERLSSLEESSKELSERLTAYSVAVDQKSDNSVPPQPTEQSQEPKKVLVINEEAKKTLKLNLGQTVQEIIQRTVKEEFNKIRGKVK